MKIHLLPIKPLIIVSLMLPVTAQAEALQTRNSENTNTDEYSINLLPPPKLNASGEVLFMSGGIGSDSLEQIKKIAPTFSLEVVLVEKTDEYYRESYIADVMVNITDKEGHTVLDAVTEGPYLLAELSSGHYQITATFNGVVKARKVTISESKHSKVILLWDNRLPKDTSKDNNADE